MTRERRELDEGEEFSTDPRHVYIGERCIYCNVNTYDDTIYGPFECVEHEPMKYTTVTPITDAEARAVADAYFEAFPQMKALINKIRTGETP